MNLTHDERAMLDGKYGKASRKAMEILVGLGTIYGAKKMVPVSSVQIAGVSYDNLGEAGLQFLSSMANGGGKARVLATLNPAGMDIDNWRSLGINSEFAENQKRVLEAFARMNVITTCTCTPYLVGNVPHFGEHIAWAESSAVCYANSVLGARTNREGGPSALASAITGRTPVYGFHLDSQRIPKLTVEVTGEISHYFDKNESFYFSALGKVIGERLETFGKKEVPYIMGIKSCSNENLKSFCASIATYGGAALFHMENITPEAAKLSSPKPTVIIERSDLDMAVQSLSSSASDEVDFISLGCPHLSIKEIAHLAELLEGKKVIKEFWITTARPIKQIADEMGYSQIIEKSGALFASDTCCVVAPIKGRFNTMLTDSAKACYYAYGKNNFKTVFKTFKEVVAEAVGEGSSHRDSKSNNSSANSILI